LLDLRIRRHRRTKNIGWHLQFRGLIVARRWLSGLRLLLCWLLWRGRRR
jgi:hypothetical protein